MKTLLDTLQAGTAYFERHGVEEARLNMEHLLAHVLECRRLELYLRFGEVPSETELEALRDLTRKRASGTPLQHLLGTVEFGELELVCDHRALIPRPETEQLVAYAIDLFETAPEKVLDLACGSGCIGLALAHRWRDAGTSVTLADLSEPALDLSRLNASRLQLDPVQILRSDLFDRIQGRFDLIVSNLPYIPSAEVPTLSKEVQADPAMALDGGEDGLDLVRRFLAQAPAHLSDGGRIALELGHDQGPTVAQLAESLGFQAVVLKSDWQNVPRFVLASAPSPSPITA